MLWNHRDNFFPFITVVKVSYPRSGQLNPDEWRKQRENLNWDRPVIRTGISYPYWRLEASLSHQAASNTRSSCLINAVNTASPSRQPAGRSAGGSAARSRLVYTTDINTTSCGEILKMTKRWETYDVWPTDTHTYVSRRTGICPRKASAPTERRRARVSAATGRSSTASRQMTALRRLTACVVLGAVNCSTNLSKKMVN